MNTKIVSTADEGSELNCLDHKIAVDNNIPFTATRHTAAAAGSSFIFFYYRCPL